MFPIFVRPALLLALASIGCASVPRASASLEVEVRPRAELLCRHGVLFRDALSWARRDPKLAESVMPEQLASVSPCEGDLGDVSRCIQDQTWLDFARTLAPHVRCEVSSISAIGGDVARVMGRRTAPRPTLAQAFEVAEGKLDVRTLPAAEVEFTLVFRLAPKGWVVDLAPAPLSPQ